MLEKFSDEQIDQIKEAFKPLLQAQEESLIGKVKDALEPIFVAAQQSFTKIDKEREQDRAEFKEFRDEMGEFREETNSHFESLEQRFQSQQPSIDEHDQNFGFLKKKPA
jgi:TRAP-type mannitol/chloroaromatic compound transport system substrate-binding protein